VWDDATKCLGSVPLSVAGVGPSDMLAQGFRSATILPGTGKLIVGE